MEGHFPPSNDELRQLKFSEMRSMNLTICLKKFSLLILTTCLAEQIFGVYYLFILYFLPSIAFLTQLPKAAARLEINIWATNHASHILNHLKNDQGFLFSSGYSLIQLGSNAVSLRINVGVLSSLRNV